MAALKAVSTFTHEGCTEHPQLTNEQILDLIEAMSKAGLTNRQIAEQIGTTEGRITDIYALGKESFNDRLRELISAAACSAKTGVKTTFVREGVVSRDNAKRQAWLAKRHAARSAAAKATSA